MFHLFYSNVGSWTEYYIRLLENNFGELWQDYGKDKNGNNV